MEIRSIFKWLLLSAFLVLSSCAREVQMMPFKNHTYSASRIFPISKSDSDFAFRVWVSNSTSIDEIISISKDEEWGEQGSIVEFGSLNKKGLLKNKNVSHYSKSSIVPKSGFDGFIKKVETMNLMEFSDQENPLKIALHQPVSLYVIEVKSGNKFNTFKFQTYYPDSAKTDSKYDEVENMILEEFK